MILFHHTELHGNYQLKLESKNPRNRSLLGKHIDAGGQHAYQFLARNIQRNRCDKAYSKKAFKPANREIRAINKSQCPKIRLL